MYFLGPKVKNAICDGTPITYTLKLINKSTVKCRGHKSSNISSLVAIFTS